MNSCPITVLTVEEFIRDYFDNVILPGTDDGTDIAMVEHLLAEMLISIRKDMLESDLDEISTKVEELLKNPDDTSLGEGFLYTLIPKIGIKNMLSKKYASVTLTRLDSKFNINENEFDFLDFTFGTLSDIKKAVNKQAIQVILNSFIINRDEGRLITPSSLNDEIEILKDNLLTAFQGKSKQNINLFYHNTLDNIEAIYRDNSEDFKNFVNLFIYKNFDNFVKRILGNYINISKDGYTFNKIENNMITSWRTGNNIDLTKEINKLSQSLINTCYYYENGRITDSFIRFEEVCLLIGKIRNMPNIRVRAYKNGIKSIINKMPKSTKAIEDTFKVLAQNKFDYFTKHENNLIQSIYNNIFDPSKQNSIYSILKLGKLSDPNYYNTILLTISSIYLVKYLQFYQNEDGSISIRDLSKLSEDNLRRSIESSILNKHSRINRDNYNENVIVTEQGNIRYNINNEINILVGSNTYNINYPKNLKLDSIPEVIDFINYYLNIDLESDIEFRNALKETFGSDLEDNLLKLASDVMFNKWVSSKYLKDKVGYTQLSNGFKEIYKDQLLPTFNYLYNEYNLISGKNLPILEAVALAKSKIVGEGMSTIVKGSDGESYNTTGLKRLLGYVETQRQEIREKSSPASHFSILQDGFHVGSYTTRDFKGDLNSKDITKFTVAELFQSYFLYEYMGRKESGKVIGTTNSGGTIAGFLPSVNSDKNTIGTELFDLAFQINNKSIESMSIEDLYEVICNELGQYYIKMLESIKESFRKLSEFTEIPIDYENNFEHFNTLSLSPYDYLMLLCLEYNRDNPTINLIEQIHFVNKKGKLKQNNTLLANIKRFSSVENLSKFMELKKKHLISNLLSENVLINLNNENDPIIKRIHVQYPNWISESNNLILAKVIAKDGNIYKITNQEELFKYLDIQSIELFPELEKYNLLDYFLTQELQLTSVGSHVGHKGNTNYVTGAIFEKTNEYTVNYDDIALELLPEKSEEEVFKYILNLAQENNLILSTNIEAFKKYCSEDFELLTNQVIENIVSEEASRFLGLHKRNVSHTAAGHPMLLNTIYSPSKVYNWAVMKDITYNLYTIHGNTELTKPFDGGTFANPFIVYLENSALEGASVGTDKKPYVHFYDYATGTGGNLKTATFGLTNTKIRKDEFYRIMMKLMTNYTWKNKAINEFKTDKQSDFIATSEVNLTKDFNGNPIDYGKFYFKKGNKFYQRELVEYSHNNIYKIRTIEVTEDGGINGLPTEPEEIVLDSNYSVWRMFGGYNSVSFNDAGLLDFSEQSIQLTVKAMINFGKPLSNIVDINNVETVWQPMKYSDIHYMPTEGAIKFGLANVNSNEGFYDAEVELNSMEVPMDGFVILLDKEHSADDSYLSLMTQVISAAAAKGYTLTESSNLYKALYSLTQLNTKDFRDLLGNITTNEDQFDAAVSNIILLHIIKNTSSTDGDLLQNIAYSLISYFKNNQTVLTKDFAMKVDSYIPYSDSRIYKKIISVLTSTLTKKGIKQEIPGNLAVLNPAQDIIKFYKVHGKKVRYGELEQYFEEYGVQSEEELLNKILETEAKIIPLHEIEIGKHYILNYPDGTSDWIKVEMPHTLPKNLRTKEGALIMGYQDIKNLEGVLIKEDLTTGSDLQSYNVKFTDGENWYLLADLDIVQTYFKLHDDFDYYKIINHINIPLFTQYIIKDLSNSTLEHVLDIEFNPYNISAYEALHPEFRKYFTTLALKFLNIEMLELLAAISEGKAVYVNNGKRIEVKSYKTQAFGCVIPKIHRSKFGLTKTDTVSDIKSNPDFFINRLRTNLKSKINNYFDLDGNEVNNFNLELKKINGKHVYIKIGLQDTNGLIKKEILKLETSDGIFRIDLNGNIIHELFSLDDEIYEDLNGNEIIVVNLDTVSFVNSQGFIVTNVILENGEYVNSITKEKVTSKVISPIKFYLDNFEYDSIYINGDEEIFKNVIGHAKNSTNRTANYIARLINDDKSISDQLNDFDALLNSGNPKLVNFVNKLFIEKGRELHTSFLKTLNIIAARIPAQNLQSFMAMEVEDFEEDDINSACVSSFLLFLQGSDLDIDAVSLQVFQVNDNGYYQGHSPYYNLLNYDLLELSKKIPYPTGENVLIKNEGTSTLNTIIDYFKLETEEDLFLNKLLGSDYNDGLIKVSLFKGKLLVYFDTSSEKNLLQLIDLINLCNQDGFTRIVDKSEFIKNSGLNLKINLVEDLENQIINLVNKHNNYIKNSSYSKKEIISLNYLTLLLYDIIANPINQLQAQSSVDVITSPIKKLANKSEKAIIQKTSTPGDVSNKFKSIVENMVGKDGIALCATGLKSFFALTLCYNSTLKYEKDVLLREIRIGGKIYRGLANINLKNLGLQEDITDTLKDYLFECYVQSDMSNEDSALLSLSTDNAKELALDKINANLDTLGMYLYGLSLGVPFETLVTIMTSNYAKKISRLVKGNVYSDLDPIYGIIGALDYLSQPPTFVYRNTIAHPKYAFKINGKLLEDVIRNKLNSPTEIITIIDALKIPEGNDDPLYINECYAYLDLLRDHANTIALKREYYSDVYGYHNVASDFETLAMGAIEYKVCGLIFKLNQGISDLNKQINTIQNLISDRAKQLVRYRRRRGEKHPEDPREDHKIDLELFLKNPEYAQEQIEIYDTMGTYNPLRVLRDVPHYKGYAETLLIAYKGMKTKSIKFDKTEELVEKYSEEWNITNLKLKDELRHNIEFEITRYIRDEWLKSLPIKLVLPKESLAYIDGKRKPILNDLPIQLGTSLGNSNFKVYIEDIVIPALKLLYPQNKFIQALIDTTKINFKEKASSYKGLLINMMPKTKYEKDIFNYYKELFNSLNDLYDDVVIKDLFYIYSVIINNGSIGSTSLHSIFEDYINDGLSKNHIDYTIRFDNKNLENHLELDVDNLNKDAFLVHSNYSKKGSNIFKYFNRDTEVTTLVEKTLDERGQSVYRSTKMPNKSEYVQIDDLSLLISPDFKLLDIVSNDDVLETKFIEYVNKFGLPTKIELVEGEMKTIINEEDLKGIIDSLKECNA